MAVRIYRYVTINGNNTNMLNQRQFDSWVQHHTDLGHEIRFETEYKHYETPSIIIRAIITTEGVA